MKKLTTIPGLALLAVCLTASNLATSEVVVVVGAGSSIGSQSKEQVADIFLGKNTSATPIDQSESDPIPGYIFRLTYMDVKWSITTAPI